MIKHFIWAASLGLLAVAGCSERKTVNLQETNTGTGGIDACALLTSKEMEAIQGAPIKETKSSEQTQGGIVISQCYFTLPTSADSIALTVIRRADGTQARGPRQLWEETFHRVEEKKIGRDGKVKEPPHPEKIDGLGDEAFWSGLQFGGTLHVLKGDYNIRISVGGPGDTATQVQRLKSLAEIILKRL